jgi:hypothetical protein
MVTLLWILAVILVIAGIFAIFRGQMLWGIVLIIVGLLVGPGGVSVFTGGGVRPPGDRGPGRDSAAAELRVQVGQGIGESAEFLAAGHEPHEVGGVDVLPAQLARHPAVRQQ